MLVTRLNFKDGCEIGTLRPPYSSYREFQPPGVYQTETTYRNTFLLTAGTEFRARIKLRVMQFYNSNPHYAHRRGAIRIHKIFFSAINLRCFLEQYAWTCPSLGGANEYIYNIVVRLVTYRINELWNL